MGDPYTTKYNQIRLLPRYTKDDPWTNDSMNEAHELLANLKQTNASIMSEAFEIFNINSANGPLHNINLDEVKKNNDFRASQNDTNKASFLNHYLYLILKIICFILLFIFLYYKLRGNFVNISTTNIGLPMERK